MAHKFTNSYAALICMLLLCNVTLAAMKAPTKAEVQNAAEMKDIPFVTKEANGIKYRFHQDPTLLSVREAVSTHEIPGPIENPEGERHLYQRECVSFYPFYESQISKAISDNIAEVINVDDTKILLGNPVSESGIGGWCEGERNGNKVTIHCPQTVVDMDVYDEYNDYTYHIAYYLMVLEKEYDAEKDAWTYVPVVDEDQTYTFIVDNSGAMTSEDPTLMLGFCGYYDEWWSHIPLGTEGGHFEWVGLGDTDQIIRPIQYQANVPPVEMIQEEYGLIYMADFEVATSRKVKGGVYDGKIYLQGIYDCLPDCWIYGNIEGDKVIIPSQYIGPDYESWFLAFTLGYEVVPDPDYPVNDTWDVTDKVVLNYDKDNNLLTIPEKCGILINTNMNPNRVLYLTRLEQVKIKLQESTADLTPLAPSDMWGMAYNDNLGMGMVGFSLNPVTAEYYILDTDRIFYELYFDGELQAFDVDGELTTRIPYDFGDDYGDTGVSKYMNERSIYIYDKVSVVSVRTGYVSENANEPLYSEKVSLVLDALGIEGISTDKTPIYTVYYDMYGRRISTPNTGTVTVKVTTMSDGTSVATKYVK